MSDGKAFKKPQQDLNVEDHLKELDRKFSVILERIQVYDKFSNDIKKLSEDLEACKKDLSENADFVRASTDVLGNQIKSAHNRVTEFKSDQVKLSKDLDNLKGMFHDGLLNLNGVILGLNESIRLMETKLNQQEAEHNSVGQFCKSLEQDLRELKRNVSGYPEEMRSVQKSHEKFKQDVGQFQSGIESRLNDILSSISSMPQFNEWATKIYIKTCNEISDKQKEVYAELDRKARHLEEKLASDPYTAESIKKYLQQQMDTLALDGKNAYLKASNAAIQMNLLEKKIETINLILKKYELTK